MEKKIFNEKQGKTVPKTRHYFASANSGNGFDNLFSQINDPAKSGFMYILKGGPGTGKSTLMKAIGKAFLDMGEDIEYFYCSSDYTSLDGVRLSNRNISVVDGTAPHVTEAQMPAVKDKIINLGEYINPAIKQYEKEIACHLQKKRTHFDAAYTYIKNAATLFESTDKILADSSIKLNTKSAAKKVIVSLETERRHNEGNANIHAATNKQNIPSQSKKHAATGAIRRLYLSAVADGGTVNLIEKNKFETIVSLSYNNLINNQILDEITLLLIQKGYKIICFNELLSPKTTNAIYVPDLNALVTKTAEERQPSGKNRETAKYLEFNNRTIDSLLKQAANALASAKKHHKKAESYYIPNMDFGCISQLTSKLIEEIQAAIY